MHKVITENWNERIKPGDTVFYLGDFSFGKPDVYLSKLNGNISLIKGNHDKYQKIKDHFRDINQHIFAQIGPFNCLLNHRPIHSEGTYDPFRDSDPYFRYGTSDIDFVICGHVHNKWKIMGKNYNVGVDVHDFKPINLDELVADLERYCVYDNGNAILRNPG